MRYRKLRIAWSVIFGLACVLLIVLWVRGYWTLDSIYWQRSGWAHGLRITSLQGGADIAWKNYGYDVGAFQFGHDTIVGRVSWLQDGKSVSHWWFHKFMPGEVYVPYWPFVLVSGTLAAVPWIRRFSLRTLLIATTLVAVVLGLVVCAARK